MISQMTNEPWDVALSESEGNNMQFRPKAKKGIKSGKGDAE